MSDDYVPALRGGSTLAGRLPRGIARPTDDELFDDAIQANRMKAADRRVSRRSWQRLADRGLCCTQCGGSEGVWAPKVLCPRCKRSAGPSSKATEAAR
jgi:hypothetical protein